MARDNTGDFQTFRFHHFVGRSLCMLMCTGLGLFLCMIGLITLFSEVTREPCVVESPPVIALSGTTSAASMPEPEPEPASSWSDGVPVDAGVVPGPVLECHRVPRDGAVSWAWFAFGGSVLYASQPHPSMWVVHRANSLMARQGTWCRRRWLQRRLQDRIC